MQADELFSLDGKVAVVIGGGGVLAGEMAMGFARAGAEVAVLDLHAGNAEARAAAIREFEEIDPSLWQPRPDAP